MQKLAALSLIAVSLPAAPAFGQAQLVDNFPYGLQRICVYSNLSRRSADSARRLRTGQPLERTMRVGLGEPCPATYRAPREVDPVSQIPSTARLTADAIDRGVRRCTYTASTRSYTVPVPLAQRCPQSPLYLPRSPSSTPARG